MFELTQQRREFNCPHRADSCFPTPLRTEALYTGILVCLKGRFNASVSNTFGEIFQIHIAPIEHSNRLGSNLLPLTVLQVLELGVRPENFTSRQLHGVCETQTIKGQILLFR